MAYNFRQRLLRDELLETQFDDPDNLDEESESENSEGSDYIHEPDADTTDAEEEDYDLADEMEDARPTKKMRQREEEEDALDSAPLAERLQRRSGSRGRSQSKLYGKGGRGKEKFVWSLNPSTRRSGKFSEYNILENEGAGITVDREASMYIRIYV